MSRVVVWYSDGAASACAAKLAVEKYGDRCVVVKCDTTPSEHLDNLRFRADVERWIGQKVVLIKSEKYTTVEDVFSARSYMSGVAGAPCTLELKKVPRYEFEQPGDVHIFGLTADEHLRIVQFEENNPEIKCEWILRDNFLRKQDCYAMILRASIRQPMMYRLGFDHNNCLGCVKATSPGYWNRVRNHFPEVFARRAEQSRALGVRLARVKGERVFLDEIPHDADGPDGDIECGPHCRTDQQELDLDGAA